MRLDHQRLLALMGRGGKQDRPLAERLVEPLEFGRVGGGGRHVEFQVAADFHPRRTQRPEARAVLLALGEAQINAGEQRPRALGKLFPAGGGAFGQPAIDQHDGRAATAQLREQVRPQFGFGQQHEVRRPVVEEAGDEGAGVQRHELVDDAGRRPPLGHAAGGERAGGEQHAEAALGEPLDQRQDGNDFADAGAVHPHQRARGALGAGIATPLGEARRVFLTLADAIGEPGRRQQRRYGTRPPVRPEGERQLAPLHVEAFIDERSVRPAPRPGGSRPRGWPAPDRGRRGGRPRPRRGRPRSVHRRRRHPSRTAGSGWLGPSSSM